jgi:NAD(P)-dependent dehydrogenase (short-subunit alcohol dehydrogenase family)
MLLLEKLKSSAPSRIINVSSVAHKRGSINFDDINSEKSYDPKKAYSQSKLANILFTRQLGQLLKGTDVFAYAVHPGLVNTEITRHMSFYNSISAYIIKPILWVFLLSASHSAHSILYCALSPHIQNDSFNGKYFRY